MTAGGVCLDTLLVGVVMPAVGSVFRGLDGLLGGVPQGVDDAWVHDPISLSVTLVVSGVAVLILDIAALWRRSAKAVEKEAML